MNVLSAMISILVAIMSAPSSIQVGPQAFGRDQFDCYISLQDGVSGAIDHTHSAPAQFILQPVAFL